MPRTAGFNDVSLSNNDTIVLRIGDVLGYSYTNGGQVAWELMDECADMATAR